MKQQINVTQLSQRIADKLDLTFKIESSGELSNFIEEVLPAIDEPFTRNSTSYDDFWRYYNDDSPIPFHQIIADKPTLRAILAEIKNEELHTEVTFYSGDFEEESDDLEDIPDGEAIADFPANGNTVELLKDLCAFSQKHSAKLTFKLYNLYPLYEVFCKRLGDSANEIVWQIENGKILTDGQEITILDETDGEFLLIQSWWLADLPIEELEPYGLRLALVTDETAQKKWEMHDCGLTKGLRLKYGK